MIPSFRAIAAFGALALGTAAAPAAVVFNGTYDSAAANAYIGLYRAGDSAGFANPSLLLGGFTDSWIFTLDEQALVSAEATVTAEALDAVPDFDLDIFSATVGSCSAPSGGSPGLCTGLVTGALRLDGTFVGITAATGIGQLGPGTYLMRVSGTPGINGAQYSGSLFVNPVPVAQASEPGSLALAGLALAGAAALRRRRPA